MEVQSWFSPSGESRALYSDSSWSPGLPRAGKDTLSWPLSADHAVGALRAHCALPSLGDTEATFESCFLAVEH